MYIPAYAFLLQYYTPIIIYINGKCNGNSNFLFTVDI